MIDDTFSHDNGDYLTMIADRLRHAVRPVDRWLASVR
jgi:hypothetical protein